MTEVDYRFQRIHSIEAIANDQFGMSLSVKKIILGDIVTGEDSYTTLFVDSSNTIYALIESDSTMSLANVMMITKSMNIEAKGYVAPHRDSDYFTKRGLEAYSLVFPGRDSNDADMSFYEKLSVYNPALVKISSFTGDLFSYNTVSKQWRKEYDKAVILAKATDNE